MIDHMDRRKNELVFMKCEQSNCSHCQHSPFQAQDTFQFLKKWNMALFTPQTSTSHPGHYKTFIEMCTSADIVQKHDAQMPSLIRSPLKMCPHCICYTFLSKSDETRHMKFFHHQNRRSTKQRARKREKKFSCNYVCPDTQK